MSDHSTLLDDTAFADAVARFVRVRPGEKVVGLHDDVMVRSEVVERRVDLTGVPVPYTSPESFVVRRITEPYPTVEVVVVTATGRPYAHRFKSTLTEFLDSVAEPALSKAS